MGKDTVLVSHSEKGGLVVKMDDDVTLINQYLRDNPNSYVTSADDGKSIKVVIEDIIE